METRYWLRHASLRGILGPYDLDALRSAIDAGSFPADSEVLPEAGTPQDAAANATGWIPVADVLGRPRPMGATRSQASAPRPKPEPPPSKHLLAMRARTAYPKLRGLIQVVMVVGIAVTALTTLIALSAVGRGGAMIGFVALCGAAWQVLLILVGAWMLQAVLDIADCALRRDR